jgi:hypothetical protein
MVYIYILKLEQNKYYIGKTSNPYYRIENHTNGSGSAWTKKYKPINVENIIPNCDHYDEDKYVIQYMDKYGISNVRGGTFSQIVLPETTIEFIKMMCKGANNKCFRCGDSGHFVKDCNYEYDVENVFLPKNKKTNKESNTKNKAISENSNIIYNAIVCALECCGCLK